MAYKTTLKIQDTKFDVEQLGHYSLNLLVSSVDFSFSITDTRGNVCLFLEKISFTTIYRSKDLISILNSVFDDHHFLRAGFWKNINCIIKNNSFSLIPNSLFDKNMLGFYLEMNSNYNPEKEEIGYFTHTTIKAVNVFSIERELSQWFESCYPTKPINFLHQTSPFIEGALRSQSDANLKLTVLCDHNSLDILLIENGLINYCNVFKYKSTEDLLYYIMFVMKELKLNPDTLPVSLYGEIDQTSIHFAKLHKYIRFLRFGAKPESLKFGYVFDELYDHQYFDLFNMTLCE